MACRPPSHESQQALAHLREQADQRGEHCLATLLAGVELYVALGREIELLEMMRSHADDLRESVRGTPTAEELRRLFEAE